MSKLGLRKTIYWLWLVMGLSMLSGCAGVWEQAPGQWNSPMWSLTPPDGWMHLSTVDSDMFSKDGPYLEYILVQSRPLDQAFRYTRQKLSARMLPHEAARLIIDNMRSDRFIHHFRLLSCEPAMVGGYSGFKLTYTYRDQMGVAIQSLYYGVILRDMYFHLRYSAAQRYYFESHLPAFERAMQSLRFVSDPKPMATGSQASQTAVSHNTRG